jgi:hypothetical protein
VSNNSTYLELSADKDLKLVIQNVSERCWNLLLKQSSQYVPEEKHGTCFNPINSQLHGNARVILKPINADTHTTQPGMIYRNTNPSH